VRHFHCRTNRAALTQCAETSGKGQREAGGDDRPLDDQVGLAGRCSGGLLRVNRRDEPKTDQDQGGGDDRPCTHVNSLLGAVVTGVLTAQ